MVYAIGWPISLEHDLPALGLPACATAEQGGCVIGWSSFAEPADPGEWLEHYRSSPGFDGQPRGDSPILCINPLTGATGGAAPASANLGTLKPNADLTSGELVPGRGPGALRRARAAADRRPARARALRAAGQQLPRLRHPAVLGERAAGRGAQGERMAAAR